MSRRAVLRLGAVGATGVALTAAGEFGAPYLAQKGLLSTDGAFAATATALGDLLFYKEKFPTSPLILNPFNDPLPIPKALAPVPVTEFSNWPLPPGPGDGQQNSLRNERHQKWSSDVGSPDPIVYKIDLHGPDPLVHHVPGAADQLARPAGGLLRRHRQAVRRRRHAEAAAQHDLRVQRRSSRAR